MIAWILGTAHAIQCTEEYSRIQLGAAMGNVDDAFASNDLGEVKRLLNETSEKLPCLQTIVDRRLFAKFASYTALLAFVGQDENNALIWGIAARLAYPDLVLDASYMPPPFVELVRTAPVPTLGGPDDQGFLPPVKGGVFLNGTFAEEPRAHADVPQLVQVFDRSQVRVDGFWQNGSVFPETILGPTKRAKPPEWWSVETGTVAAIPGAAPSSGGGGGGSDVPVLPLAVSGGLLATSGLTYVLASVAQSSMANGTTSAQLTSSRSRANSFVFVSGLTLAGAVGVGVGGVLLSADGVGVRVRF